MLRYSLPLTFTILMTTTAGAMQPVIALDVFSGPVFLDQGQGMISIESGASLKAGDRILLKSGGSALLTGPEGNCTLSLRDAGVYNVPDLSNCNQGQAAILPAQYTITPTNGVYTTIEPETVVFEGVHSGFIAGLTFVAAVTAATLYTIVEERPVSDN